MIIIKWVLILFISQNLLVLIVIWFNFLRLDAVNYVNKSSRVRVILIFYLSINIIRTLKTYQTLKIVKHYVLIILNLNLSFTNFILSILKFKVSILVKCILSVLVGEIIVIFILNLKTTVSLCTMYVFGLEN